MDDYRMCIRQKDKKFTHELLQARRDKFVRFNQLDLRIIDERIEVSCNLDSIPIKLPALN